MTGGIGQAATTFLIFGCLLYAIGRRRNWARLVFSFLYIVGVFFALTMMGRFRAAGTIAAMLSGAIASSALSLTGLVIAFRAGKPSEFHAYELLGFDPLIWGLAASLAAGVLISLVTRPPEERLVSKLFDASDAAIAA